MKFIAIAALVAGTEGLKLASQNKFAPPADGPYAKDIDHLSAECYGADEDDIMYDTFARYRVEEVNPLGAGTGVWKLPKNSGPQWAADILRKFNVMKDDQVDAYVSANFDNFWKKYDNNGTGEIYESEGETFMRALLGPNNRFRLAPGALSDMESTAQIVQNEFSVVPEADTFAHAYTITPTAVAYPQGANALAPGEENSFQENKSNYEDNGLA
jgi:hypothetical protein